MLEQALESTMSDYTLVIFGSEDGRSSAEFSASSLDPFSSEQPYVP